MRIKIIVLVVMLFPLALAAQTASKIVAIMEPVRITEQVTVMQCQIVRGGMEAAIANAPGYEEFDRTSFDALVREQYGQFLSLSESQIKELGERAGVRYVVVPEITAEGDDFYILVRMLDVTDEKFGVAYDRLCKNISTEIKNSCAEIVKQLFVVEYSELEEESSLEEDDDSYDRDFVVAVVESPMEEDDDSYGNDHDSDAAVVELSIEEDEDYYGDDQDAVVAVVESPMAEYEDSYGNGQDVVVAVEESPLEEDEDSYENDQNAVVAVVDLQLEEGRYSGEVMAGSPHGKGVIYYNSDNGRNRISYDGSWIDGKPDGYGTMIWNNGQKYEGNWKAGHAHGQGKLYYADGNVAYEGDWAEDKLNGHGTLYYADEDKYNRVKYEGNWLNGNYDGLGTEYYSNRDKFVGNWKNGIKYGEGTYYFANGDEYVVSYEYDESVGHKIVETDLSVIDNYVLNINYSDRNSVNYKNLVDLITKNSNTKYEKARAIYMWIANNIAYDVDYRISNADEAFRQRKGVCAGYAGLYEKLCKLSGLDVVTVSGICKDETYEIGTVDLDKQKHAWNVVKDDNGRWFFVDATWGAGSVDNGVFERDIESFWFDSDPSLFVLTHLPKNNDWQLIDKPLSREEFGLFPPVYPNVGIMGLNGKKLLSHIRSDVNHSFPKMYTYSKIRIKINQMPLAGTLSSGNIYKFSFTAPKNIEMAIYQNGKFYHFKVVGDYRTLEYQPSKGSMAVYWRENQGLYNALFKYEVE